MCFYLYVSSLARSTAFDATSASFYGTPYTGRPHSAQTHRDLATAQARPAARTRRAQAPRCEVARRLDTHKHRQNSRTSGTPLHHFHNPPSALITSASSPYVFLVHAATQPRSYEDDGAHNEHPVDAPSHSTATCTAERAQKSS